MLLITDKGLVISLFSREPRTEEIAIGSMREEPIPNFRFVLVPTTEGPAIFECFVVFVRAGLDAEADVAPLPPPAVDTAAIDEPRSLPFRAPSFEQTATYCRCVQN